MNEREYRPLLAADASDEEELRPHHCHTRVLSWQTRRTMSLDVKGRARNKIKGAAAIMKQWPDHLSSTALYWWLGVAIFFLVFLIVFNCLITITNLPAANLFRINKLPQPIRNYTLSSASSLQIKPKISVYSHIIVRHINDLLIDKYRLSMNHLAKKYPNFNFEFLILIDDTYPENFAVRKEVDAEIINAHALKEILNKQTRNSIIGQRFSQKQENDDVKVTEILLSIFMDKSPLKEIWKSIPHELFSLLVKAISIWERGGVSVDPDLLNLDIKGTVHKIDLEKVLNLMYNSTSKPFTEVTYEVKENNASKYNLLSKNKNINNIRDVIESLDNDISPQETELLLEAESNRNDSFIKLRRLMSEPDVNTRNTNASYTKEKEWAFNNTTTKENKNLLNAKEVPYISLHYDAPELLEPTYDRYENTKNNFLPYFLNLIFGKSFNFTKPWIIKKSGTDIIEMPFQEGKAHKKEKMRYERVAPSTKVPLLYDKPSLRPIIIVPKNGEIKTSFNEEKLVLPSKDEYFDDKSLMLDVNARILATKTPCHSFIGLIFSTVHNYTDLSISDFIIKELSIFCNGILGSCKGIHLLLT